MKIITTILEKDGGFGVLGYFSDGKMALTASYDTRNGTSNAKQHENVFKALTEYNDAVRISIERGWTLAFRGQPNNPLLS